MMTDCVLQVNGLRKWFPIRRGILGRTTGYVRAVDGIDLAIGRGTTLGLVGESGSGKTTAGLAILRLTGPAQGEVLFDGLNVLDLNGSDLLGFRRHAQIIFQDPYSSLDPRMSVLAAIREPMDIRGEGPVKKRNERVKEILSLVGLPSNSASKYPHELSGGQRQRVCIAKALASQPKFLVCDEPVSALDVSIRSQILNLLEDLKKTLGLTYLFISHDLSVVRHVCNEVAVMYLGRVIESATTAELFSESLHPYTRALLSAIPAIGSSQKKRIILTGELPSPANVPGGCRFHPRCYEKLGEICERDDPPAVVLKSGHTVACHRYAQ